MASGVSEHPDDEFIEELQAAIQTENEDKLTNLFLGLTTAQEEAIKDELNWLTNQAAKHCCWEFFEQLKEREISYDPIGLGSDNSAVFIIFWKNLNKQTRSEIKKKQYKPEEKDELLCYLIQQHAKIPATKDDEQFPLLQLLRTEYDEFQKARVLAFQLINEKVASGEILPLSSPTYTAKGDPLLVYMAKNIERYSPCALKQLWINTDNVLIKQTTLAELQLKPTYIYTELLKELGDELVSEAKRTEENGFHIVSNNSIVSLSSMPYALNNPNLERKHKRRIVLNKLKSTFAYKARKIHYRRGSAQESLMRYREPFAVTHVKPVDVTNRQLTFIPDLSLIPNAQKPPCSAAHQKQNSSHDRAYSFKRRQSLKRSLICELEKKASSTDLDPSSSLFERRRSSLESEIPLLQNTSHSSQSSLFISIPEEDSDNDEQVFSEAPKFFVPSTPALPISPVSPHSFEFPEETSVCSIDSETKLLPQCPINSPPLTATERGINSIAKAVARTSAPLLDDAGSSTNKPTTFLVPILEGDEISAQERQEKKALINQKRIQRIESNISLINNQEIKVAAIPPQKDMSYSEEDAKANYQIYQLKKACNELQRYIQSSTNNKSKYVSAAIEGSCCTTTVWAVFSKDDAKQAINNIQGVSKTLAGLQHCLFAVLILFKDLKQASCQTVKEHTADSDESGQYLKEGLSYSHRCIEIASGIADVAESLSTVLKANYASQALGKATPGIGLVLSISNLADNFIHIAKEFKSYAQLSEMKERLKDSFVDDGELCRLINPETWKTNQHELETCAFNSDDDANVSDDLIVESKRYYLTQQIKIIERKRLERQLLHLFSNSVALIGSIMELTGVASEVGITISATSSVIELGAQGIRVTKQKYNNITNSDKSETMKEETRNRVIGIMLSLVDMIQQPSDVDFDQELAIHQYYEVKIYFRAIGISIADFIKQKSPERRLNMLHDSLKNRD